MKKFAIVDPRWIDAVFRFVRSSSEIFPLDIHHFSDNPVNFLSFVLAERASSRTCFARFPDSGKIQLISISSFRFPSRLWHFPIVMFFVGSSFWFRKSTWNFRSWTKSFVDHSTSESQRAVVLCTFFCTIFRQICSVSLEVTEFCDSLVQFRGPFDDFRNNHSAKLTTSRSQIEK